MEQSQLRSQPINDLSGAAVKVMLTDRDFFDSRWNEQGRGLRNDYEATTQQDKKLVIDHSTGLTWQQSGSPESLTFATGQEYIQKLNDQKYANYNDWRLPTLEEAMSLMKPTKNKDGLFIDANFDSTQWALWTVDEFGASVAWVVYFYGGSCFNHCVSDGYVRGVR